MKYFLKKHSKKIKISISIGLSILFFYFLYRLYELGILTNSDKLYDYIGAFSYFAPLIFIILKVLIGFVPFIPTTIFIVIGFALFGQKFGLFLNYITGLMTAVLNYTLTRIYGKRFLNFFLPKKSIKKYESATRQSTKRFKKVLFLTSAMPFAPDNALSMVAGFKKLRFKEYIKIMTVAKFIEILIIAYLMYHLKLFLA
ncbi:TVP38/TMEM64 family protein [Anaerococcus hydrogenalis]|uniref:TVP38/TMEM64 family membrane protein n=1 Tax=Anaerococcus hydrogenalis TaxID=33029 RepID=A0A2N6UGW2_9FIRM|nr:VTT domain-containing protein [Anaerococcus hydrogenalis]MDK7695731.1 VTT domain-containing protein [Anaerococcus hydrogenalis]MDK7697446.1 VTT domain-containing protein [Anaerococcus hydrogenalis]MDK7708713.1 VTT domain-containing protein [Anaerococcus hydrogenalis]PMC80851.1 TVP38/TMEM64 family protein [Anaerococcus hydrogenalis]